MSYQCGTVAPYWVKTQIFRRKGLTPPQLYTFSDDSDKVVGTGKLSMSYEKAV